MSTAFTTLATLVAYGALAFGWRSWLQWRRTGSTGFRGLSGRVGSAEWFGGVLLVVAFVLAALAPIAVMAGLSSTIMVPSAAVVVGAALMSLGFVGTLAAQLSMGDSWRVGVDERERTELVARGLFRFMRNPIFTSMLALLAGLVLVLPTVMSVGALGCALVGLEIQVRLVEEPYLLRTHRGAYAAYAKRVGRFLPLVGRMRGTP